MVRFGRHMASTAVWGFTFGALFQCSPSGVTRCFSPPSAGRRRKEEAMLAIALNRIYTPTCASRIPEIVDFFLPNGRAEAKVWPLIAIDRLPPGQAKRAANGPSGGLPPVQPTQVRVVFDPQHQHPLNPRPG